MSFLWFLLILLIQSEHFNLISSFNDKLYTRRTLNRWSHSPESCGINWRPLKRRLFSCFQRMSAKVQMVREEYDRIVATYPTGTPPTTSTSTVRTSVRVVGGTDTLRGEFPWTVSIEQKIYYDLDYWERTCSGSFIMANWIITAAHCLYSGDDKEFPKDRPFPPERIRIRFNANVQIYDNLNTSMVAETFIHPEFNRTGRMNFAADIGLMRLVQNVTFNSIDRSSAQLGQQHYYDANALCLPDKPWSVGYINEDVFSFASYGPISYSKDPIVDPEFPKKLMVVPKEYWNPLLNRSFLQSNYRHGYANCAGDSGSTLAFHNNDGRFFIAGMIQSAPRWNDSVICGYGVGYQVQLARADSLDWIKETIINGTG